MQIRNTDHEAVHPWPEGIFIQGGGKGLVVRPDGTSYGTAFVEVCPSGPPATFLRGEGLTIEEAEEAAWTKYQAYLNCDGTGPHGPYEARSYENGSGYCTRCGIWFSEVLEPSEKYQLQEEANRNLQEGYGEEILWHPRSRELRKEEVAILTARAHGDPIPERTVIPPTEEELRPAEGISEEDFATALTSIFDSILGGDEE